MAKKKQIFDISKAKEIGKMVTQPIIPKSTPPPAPKKTEVIKEKVAPVVAKVTKPPKATKKANNKSTSEELAYKRHLKYRNENVRIYCNRDLFDKLKTYAEKQRKSPKIIIEEYIESLKV